MSGMGSRERTEQTSMDDLNYLWSEYKYRHELCWSAVYKVSVAVLALAILPYAKDNLTKLLEYWMLVPSAVGAALAGFGIALVSNELEIFAQIKLAYHTVQTAFFERVIPDAATRKAATHKISPANMRNTRFDRYVFGFMVGLLVLSVANGIFLAAQWIPHLRER